MLNVKTMNRFEKDLKKAIKQHRDIEELKTVMRRLAEQMPLGAEYLDHPLKGQWRGCRECHIENDWLLIYRLRKNENEIWFERLGTHSELFK